MEFRHEWKHEINQTDLFVLRQRLRAVARPDPHAAGGFYRIRSLYFDNAADKALWEKLDGLSRREKFRIRYYNDDLSVIHLEKKTKLGGLGNKQIADLTAQQTQSIIEGIAGIKDIKGIKGIDDADGSSSIDGIDGVNGLNGIDGVNSINGIDGRGADGGCGWMAQSENALIRELHCKMQTQGLRPKTIVEYTREPFVYAPGNVRVTLDYNIRTGLSSTDFLNPECITIPAGDAPILLEVKWDGFLPDIIRDAVSLPGRRMSAFSKYAQCRIYG